jgi:hypothetical protein
MQFRLKLQTCLLLDQEPDESKNMWKDVIPGLVLLVKCDRTEEEWNGIWLWAFGDLAGHSDEVLESWKREGAWISK